MRLEVVKSIRMYRNNTRNAVQKSIVEGKYLYDYKFQSSAPYESN